MVYNWNKQQEFDPTATLRLPLQCAGNSADMHAVLGADGDGVPDLQRHLTGLQLKREALVQPRQRRLGLLHIAQPTDYSCKRHVSEEMSGE